MENTYNKLDIEDLIEYLEEDWFNFDEKINQLTDKFYNAWYSLNKEKISEFLYWFFNIKSIIRNNYINNNKPIINFSKIFAKDNINNIDYGYISEGCYNITFNYSWLFAVKIPKIELFYIENIQDIQDYSDNFENAYGIFAENDIKNENVSDNIIDYYNDFIYILNNLVILPDFIDENLLFWIYPLWVEIDLNKNNKIIQNWLNLQNIEIFNFLIQINEDSKLSEKYDDIINWLDFKIEHILIINNNIIKYCDIDENVIISFLNLIKEYKN